MAKNKLTTVRFIPNGKTPISPVQWVSLYCDLACHIESKLYPNRKTHNEYGDRLEETEDDFLEIVDDVEEIMSHYFTKD